VKIAGNQFVEELCCKLDIQGYSTYKIADQLRDATGEKYDHSEVWRFLNSKANQPKVQALRQKYYSDPQAVALANKRARLEDLNRERVRILRTIEHMCGKDSLIPLKKVSKYLGLTKRLVDIEIAGRDEIEKRPDFIGLFQRIGPYSEVSDAELIREARVIEQKLIAIRSGGSLAEKNPYREGTEGAPEEESA